MYKLNSQSNKPFLNYRHNAKQKKQLDQGPKINFKTNSPVDANTIISDWSALAKDALDGAYKESSLVCWDGHYEQFGRLMYELYAISENRSVRLAKYSVEYQNFFPQVENLSFIPEGPAGTEDRTFYRIWFKMLGHPDFSDPIIDNLETEVYAVWTFLLTKVYMNLNVQIHTGLI